MKVRTRKFISTMMAVVMLISMFPVSAFASEEDQGNTMPETQAEEIITTVEETEDEIIPEEVPAEDTEKPEDESPVEPSAEPSTEPDTEPSTEPDTEPSIEPGTEPSTEPGAEPSAEPSSEPAAQTESGNGEDEGDDSQPPEEVVTPAAPQGLSLMMGDPADPDLSLFIEGSFTSDLDLSLAELDEDEIAWTQYCMEQALGYQVENYLGVKIVNDEGLLMMLGQDDVDEEFLLPVTVSGKWIEGYAGSENTVFALMNGSIEDAEIVPAALYEPEDAASFFTLDADCLLVLMVAENTGIPAEDPYAVTDTVDETGDGVLPEENHTTEPETTPAAEGEEPKTEEPAAEPTPELVYTGELTAELDGISVLAEVPEGVLNEYAQLNLQPYSAEAAAATVLAVVNDGIAVDAVEEAVAEESEHTDEAAPAAGAETVETVPAPQLQQVASLFTLDIGFVAGGYPAYPNGTAPIRVTVTSDAICGMAQPRLFHLVDGTANELVDAAFDTAAGTVVFESVAFSPFVVVDITTGAAVPTAEQPEEPAVPELPADHRVERTLTDDKSGIEVAGLLPENAELQVVAIPLNTAAEIYNMQTGEAAAEEEILFAYDISILSDGEKYDLEAFSDSITVTMKNAFSEEQAEQQHNIDVLHVKVDVTDGEGGLDSEKIDALCTAEAEKENLEAGTEGSSVFFDLTSCSTVIVRDVKATGDDIVKPFVTYELNWINAEDATSSYNEDGDLILTPVSSTSIREARMQIKFKFNAAETDQLPEGSVKFQVPKYIFQNWQGGVDVNMNLSGSNEGRWNTQPISWQVPKAPAVAASSDFNYTESEDGNYYILSNVGPIKGDVTLIVDIAYQYFGFAIAVDETGTYRNENVTVTMTVDDDTYDIHTVEPLTKTIEVHTKSFPASITKTQDGSSGTENHKFMGWQSAWGEKPADADNYFYIYWHLKITRRTNSSTIPYDIILQEMNTTIFAGSKEIVLENPEDYVVGITYYQNYYSDKTIGFFVNSDTPPLTGIAGRDYSRRPGVKVPYNNMGTNQRNSSTMLDTTANAQWGVLTRYPKSLFQEAIDNGMTRDDLINTGLKIQNTARTYNVQANGLTVNGNTASATTYFRLQPAGGAGGGFTKTNDSNGYRVLTGAADMLLHAGKSYTMGDGGSHSRAFKITGTFSPVYKPTAGENGELAIQPYTYSITDGDMFFTPMDTTPSQQGAGDCTTWEGCTPLIDGDYTFTQFALSLITYKGNYVEVGTAEEGEDPEILVSRGSEMTGEEMEPIYLYVRRAGEDDFSLYGTLTKNGTANTFKFTRDENCSDGVASVNAVTIGTGGYGGSTFLTLPANTVDIKVEHTTTAYSGSIQIDLRSRVCSTEHTREILAISEEKGVNTAMTNHAFYAIRDGVTDEVVREGQVPTTQGNDRYQSYRLDRLPNSMSAGKTVFTSTGLVDEVEKTRQYYRVACYMHLDSGLAAGNYDANLMRLYWPETGFFYDLLPAGCTVDESTVNLLYASATTTMSAGSFFEKDRFRVQVEKNWNGTGRDLLTVEILDSRDGPTNWRGGNYVMTYYMYNSYANIVDRGTDTENVFGFVNTDEDAARLRTTNNRIGNLGTEQSIMREVMAEKMGENGWDESWLATHSVYAQNSYIFKNIGIKQTGYSKTVSTELNSDYLKQNLSLIGDDYAYRISYVQNEGTVSSNIVLFDVLEQGSFLTTQASEWQGSFQNLDVSLIAAKPNANDMAAMCSPVVWYATSIPSDDDLTIEGLDVNASGVWTQTMPADPSTVKAFAVDCRRDTKGNLYTLPEDGFITMFVYMNAPWDRDLADLTTVNGTKLISDLTSLAGGSMSPGIVSDASCEMTLLDPNLQLHKMSNPATGTAATPTEVAVGGTITYLLPLSVGDEKHEVNYTLRNIVVTDPIPEGLTVNAADIRYYTNSSATLQTLGRTKMAQVTQDGQLLTFTVPQLSKGQTIYFVIPTTVDELKDAAGNQVFLRDFVNTATLESVDGTPVEEDTETTYHRAESVKAKVIKEWDDIDGSGRPESITAILSKGTDSLETVGTVTLNADNNWTATVENLPKYNVDTTGADYENPTTWTEITYTWDEDEETLPAIYQKTSVETGDWEETGGSVVGVITTITNTYVAEGSWIPEVTKVLEGRPIVAGEFNFSVKDETGAEVSTGTVNADGSVTFTAVEYDRDDIGTHIYTITEVAGQAPGVTYATNTVTATVTVTDNGDGTLASEASCDPEEATFINTFEATGEWSPTVYKILDGRDMEEGETFTVTVQDAEGTVLMTGTVSNGKDGQATAFVFPDKITYTEADLVNMQPTDFTYTITETKGDSGSMKYDETSYDVTVTVALDPITNDAGEITGYKDTLAVTDDAPEEGITFVNTYVALPTEATPRAEKKMAGETTGKRLSFEFTLEATEFTPENAVFLTEDFVPGSKTNTPVAVGTTWTRSIEVPAGTTKDSAALGVDFDSFTYTLAGTYQFTITETVAEGDPNVTYDSPNVWNLTVTVEDNKKGSLVATSVYARTAETGESETSDSAALFTNTYEPQPTSWPPVVEKILTGETLHDPENTVFTFELSAMSAGEGFKLPAETTVTITGAELMANGLDLQKTFGAITFEKAGFYTFKIVEVKGNTPNVHYDDTEWQVKVDVIDTDGTLTVRHYDYWKNNQIDNSKSAAWFTNKYDPASYIPHVYKVVEGDERPAGMEKETFTFEIVSDSSSTSELLNPPTTVAILDPGGEASFGRITFSKAGTYTYTIREVVPESHPDYYVYDTTPWTLTVEVKADEAGDLYVVDSPSYSRTVDGKKETGTDYAKFTNRYEPLPTEYVLYAKKLMTGEPTAADRDFTFVLEATVNPNGGAVLPVDPDTGKAARTVTVMAGETETAATPFDAIRFNKAGKYTFKITETAGSLPGITYAVGSVLVTVTVGDRQGVLEVRSIAAVVDGADQTPEGTRVNVVKETRDQVVDGAVETVTLVTAEFTNKYDVLPVDYTPAVVKIMTEHYGLAEEDLTFNFTMAPAEGNPETGWSVDKHTVDGTELAGTKTTLTIPAKSVADVEALFGAITFTRAGTYTFTVTEDAGDTADVTYDTSEWLLTVTVTDDATGATNQLSAAATYEKLGEETQSADTAEAGDTTEAGSTTEAALAEESGETAAVEAAVFENHYTQKTMDFQFNKLGEVAAGTEGATEFTLETTDPITGKPIVIAIAPFAGAEFALYTEDAFVDTTDFQFVEPKPAPAYTSTKSDENGVVTFADVAFAVDDTVTPPECSAKTYYMVESDKGEHGDAYWDNDAVYKVVVTPGSVEKQGEGTSATARVTDPTVSIDLAKEATGTDSGTGTGILTATTAGSGDADETGETSEPADDNTQAATEYSIINLLISYRIRLLKVDHASEQPLNNAKFNLFRADDITLDADGKIPADAPPINAKPLVTTTIDNAEGMLDLGRMLPGRYYLQEVEVPASTSDFYEYRVMEKPILLTLTTTEATVTGPEFTIAGTSTKYASIAQKGTADPAHEYTVTVRNVPFGDLKIVKTLDTYAGPEIATFVFEITWSDLDGNEQMRVAAISFNAEGKDEYILEKQIPVGASATVTEVESGLQYTAVSDLSGSAIIAADKIAEVSFENDHDNPGGGHGAVNRFTRQGGDWTWNRYEESSPAPETTA